MQNNHDSNSSCNDGSSNDNGSNKTMTGGTAVIMVFFVTLCNTECRGYVTWSSKSKTFCPTYRCPESWVKTFSHSCGGVWKYSVIGGLFLDGHGRVGFGQRAAARIPMNPRIKVLSCSSPANVNKPAPYRRVTIFHFSLSRTLSLTPSLNKVIILAWGTYNQEVSSKSSIVGTVWCQKCIRKLALWNGHN